MLKSGFSMFGTKGPNDERLLVEDSDKLFKRPLTVYQLRKDSDFHEGPYDYDGPHIEGDLRGPVRFDAYPWSKPWLDLTSLYTSKDGRGDYFLFVDDAVVVAAP